MKGVKILCTRKITENFTSVINRVGGSDVPVNMVRSVSGDVVRVKPVDFIRRFETGRRKQRSTNQDRC